MAIAGHKNAANMTPQNKHIKNIKQIKIKIDIADDLLGLLVQVHFKIVPVAADF